MNSSTSKKTALVLVGALCVIAAFVACVDDGADGSPGSFDAGFDVTYDTGGGETDGGENDTGTADAGTDAPTCTPGALPVFSDGGTGPFLEPSQYFQRSDSPFYCRELAYYHVADFEGDGGLTPGLSATLGALGTTPGSLAPIIDSVDGDDGIADGGVDGARYPCERCNSWFNPNGPEGVAFEFDGTALGGLPTRAGLVWTDGTGPLTVTFTAYSEDGGVIGTQVVSPIGDGSNIGETAEDRFFGIIHDAGVKRITMSNTSGGIEVDHVQYGR